MRVLVVDPSPLAQNLYRLLLQNVDAGVRVTTADSIAQLHDLQKLADVDLLVIASLLLEGDNAKYRAFLTDIPQFADIAKVVMVRPGTAVQHRAWQNLPNALEIQRPFRPDEFEKRVKTFFHG